MKSQPRVAGNLDLAREDGRKTRRTRAESLVDQVRLVILDDLIQGRLRPGTVVRVPDIAARCGVSRTPVREALTVLAHEGVVTSIPYKGYLVREISPAEVNDVFFMRRLIEPVAAEMAAESLDADELERLIAESESHPPTGTAMTLEYDRLAHDFHRTIIAATRSVRLVSTFEAIYSDVRRLQSVTMGTPRPDLIHAEHGSILEALARHDGATARARMEAHLDAIRTRAFVAWVGFDPTSGR